VSTGAQLYQKITKRCGYLEMAFGAAPNQLMIICRSKDAGQICTNLMNLRRLGRWINFSSEVTDHLHEDDDLIELNSLISAIHLKKWDDVIEAVNQLRKLGPDHGTASRFFYQSIGLIYQSIVERYLNVGRYRLYRFLYQISEERKTLHVPSTSLDNVGLDSESAKIEKYIKCLCNGEGLEDFELKNAVRIAYWTSVLKAKYQNLLIEQRM
jgi:hypothetical protein